MTPRKIRLVCRLLRGQDVPQAEAILQNLPKKACKPIFKVLESAVANASRQGSVAREQLYVSKIMADGGPAGGGAHRRFRAAAMGRASTYRKRTSHLTIELDIRKT